MEQHTHDSIVHKVELQYDIQQANNCVETIIYTEYCKYDSI